MARVSEDAPSFLTPARLKQRENKVSFSPPGWDVVRIHRILGIIRRYASLAAKIKLRRALRRERGQEVCSVSDVSPEQTSQLLLPQLLLFSATASSSSALVGLPVSRAPPELPALPHHYLRTSMMKPCTNQHS